jgi:hypothetical protein
VSWISRLARFWNQARVACALSGDSLAAFAELRDTDPLEVYERGGINTRESTNMPSLQTCMCMYSCTLLCVHDRYRDNATLMKAHKSIDTLVRPLRGLIGADTLSPVTSLTAHRQTSLFKERRLGNRLRAFAKIGVRIRRERGICKTFNAQTRQRPCRCFTTNHSVRGRHRMHRSLIIAVGSPQQRDGNGICNVSATTTRLDSIYRVRSSRPQALGTVTCTSCTDLGPFYRWRS